MHPMMQAWMFGFVSGAIVLAVCNQMGDYLEKKEKMVQKANQKR